ncbi:hypothetical protein [Microbacterium immunditiarum]|uniref:Uncharacterized protein n=1 Tax=Microbacterium immunditiarum TaxID=337480 RepID=A0A7Y9GMZ1_9MICO|nr:hypothetical protein [Microbacterium immunditiarum]NYE19468.1 hypothetical protein [Microbacterium immunditiarum]
MTEDLTKWVKIVGELLIPETVDAEGITDPEWAFTVDARLVFDTRTMVYEIVRITLRTDHQESTTPITATGIRQLSLKRLSDLIFQGDLPVIAISLEKLTSLSELGTIGIAPLVHSAGRRPTPEVLETVAMFYALYFAYKSNPTQMISRLMKIPPRTASHWVSLARARGYLSSDPTKSVDTVEIIEAEKALSHAIGPVSEPATEHMDYKPRGRAVSVKGRTGQEISAKSHRSGGKKLSPDSVSASWRGVEVPSEDD